MVSYFILVLQVSRFLEAWLTGTSPVQYTPAGLAWVSEWGTLRYTMNAALIAEIWSQYIAGKLLWRMHNLLSYSVLQQSCVLCMYAQEHQCW